MQDNHLSQLDGIRGIAILIVLLGHLITQPIGFEIVRLGPLPAVGVDLFFVLSGFLITNVLLRAKDKEHFFVNFYSRRALRIVPLYFALLIFMFGIANHRLAALTFNDQKLHWQVFAFYLQNIYYHQTSELGPLALAVTWSLAIEEQFYMVWPLLISKLTIRKLSVVAGVLIFIAPIARIVVPWFGYDPYINPLCRVDAMAMGALLSFWIVRLKPSSNVIKKASCACRGSWDDWRNHLPLYGIHAYPEQIAGGYDVYSSHSALVGVGTAVQDIEHRTPSLHRQSELLPLFIARCCRRPCLSPAPWIEPGYESDAINSDYGAELPGFVYVMGFI